MNNFVLCYLAAAIFLLTLSPFDFQPYVPSEFWVFRASIEDVSRNILLFMPLGMLLRHTFGQSHRTALLGGFLLSLSVECAQLFIEARTSNIADLMSNSSGAFLGSILYQQLFESKGRSPTQKKSSAIASSTLPISLMFIPLCWMNALRSTTDPAMVWLAIQNAIAGILLIQQADTHTKQLPNLTKGAFTKSNLTQSVLGSCWSMLALLPLVNTSPQAVWAFLGITPILIAVGARLSTRIKRQGVIAALLTGLIAVMLNLLILHKTTDPNGEVLSGSSRAIAENVANKRRLFQTAEIVFLSVTALVTGYWYRHDDKS